MSCCEAEQNKVNQLQSEVSQKAAYASMICASQGYLSTECQGAQSEVSHLRVQLIEAQQALRECEASCPPEASSRLLQARGYITFLLINDGGGYGGGSDNWIDADVVFKLDSRPDKGFGFQLREGPPEFIRQGMLALLSDAFVNRLQVITDYIEPVTTPNTNCLVIRVALLYTPSPPSGPLVSPGQVAQAVDL
jgi:hypothetical protein